MDAPSSVGYHQDGARSGEYAVVNQWPRCYQRAHEREQQKYIEVELWSQSVSERVPDSAPLFTHRFSLE